MPQNSTDSTPPTPKPALARLLMDLLLAAGHGTLMLAPVIVPPEDHS